MPRSASPDAVPTTLDSGPRAYDYLGASQRRTAVPAWFGSLILHLSVFIVLGLLIRGASHGLPGEGTRPVGIVLASGNSEEDNTYVTDADARQAAAQSNAESTPDPLAQIDPQQVQLPPIDLPGHVDAATSTDPRLTAKPNLTVSGRPVIASNAVTAEELAAEAAGRKRRGPKGPVAQVSLFGSAAAPGRSFVFVLDRSDSMGGEGLGVLSDAETELVRALERLEPVHRFQIIAYNTKRVFMTDRELISASVENRGRVSNFLGGLAAFGGTNHKQALLTALDLEPDVVFLLTDGGDPELNTADLLAIHSAAGNTSIHCIQFGLGPLGDSDPCLQRLALQNRGSYGYVDVGR